MVMEEVNELVVAQKRKDPQGSTLGLLMLEEAKELLILETERQLHSSNSDVIELLVVVSEWS